MRPPVRPPAGITLIELAITLTIIGIIATMVAPSVRALMDRHALGGSADVLRSDLQYVRAESIARDERVWFAVQASGTGACYIAYTGNRDDCSCDAQGAGRCNASGTLLRATGFADGGRIRLAANTGPMRFDPARGTVSPAGTLTLSSAEDDAVEVIVTPLGRVRACTPTHVSGYPAC